jgi:hypothetical protein
MKLVLFGNCHFDNLVKHINAFCPDVFEIHYLVSYQNLDKFENFKKQLLDADLLIMNPVQNYNDFSMKNIRLFYQKPIIRFPFVRFYGYWNFEKTRPLSKFKSNTVANFPDIDFENVDDFLDTDTITADFFEEQLQKLAEIEANSDILFYDFFIQYHQDFPMFRDPYHPTQNILKFLYNQVLINLKDRFGLTPTKLLIPKLDAEPCEYGHYYPISNKTAQLLGLQYNLDKTFLWSRKHYLEKIISIEKDPNAESVTDLEELCSR